MCRDILEGRKIRNRTEILEIEKLEIEKQNDRVAERRRKTLFLTHGNGDLSLGKANVSKVMSITHERDLQMLCDEGSGFQASPSSGL